MPLYFKHRIKQSYHIYARKNIIKAEPSDPTQYDLHSDWHRVQYRGRIAAKLSVGFSNSFLVQAVEKRFHGPTCMGTNFKKNKSNFSFPF